MGNLILRGHSLAKSKNLPFALTRREKLGRIWSIADGRWLFARKALAVCVVVFCRGMAAVGRLSAVFCVRVPWTGVNQGLGLAWSAADVHRQAFLLFLCLVLSNHHAS